MKKFRETCTLNGVKSVPMDTANPVAAVQVDEKTMQLWERDPMRYRDQIMILEKRMRDERRERFENKTGWYFRKDLTLEEILAYSRKDRMESKLYIRIINLTARIERMDKPQKCRNVISNGPQVLIQTAEQYVMSLMMKQCITIGKA
jgi:hypothetical protein